MAFARALAAAPSAQNRTYPNRPITMLVAFAPGGADDAIAPINGEGVGADDRHRKPLAVLVA